jgi:hypothetical protein
LGELLPNFKQENGEEILFLGGIYNKKKNRKDISVVFKIYQQLAISIVYSNNCLQ